MTLPDLHPGDAVEFRASETDDWRRGVLIRVGPLVLNLSTNWMCEERATGATWIIGNPANIRAVKDEDSK